MIASRVFCLSAALAMGMSLTACGAPEPSEPPREQHQGLQRAIQEPLDKARAAEDALQKQQEAMQRQIEEDGG